jgi:hypothetical protein
MTAGLPVGEIEAILTVQRQARGGAEIGRESLTVAGRAFEPGAGDHQGGVIGTMRQMKWPAATPSPRPRRRRPHDRRVHRASWGGQGDR